MPNLGNIINRIYFSKESNVLISEDLETITLTVEQDQVTRILAGKKLLITDNIVNAWPCNEYYKGCDACCLLEKRTTPGTSTRDPESLWDVLTEKNDLRGTRAVYELFMLDQYVSLSIYAPKPYMLAHACYPQTVITKCKHNNKELERRRTVVFNITSDKKRKPAINLFRNIANVG